MTSLRVLICGGGIGGPALAFWLTRAGHNVVICERFDSLRATGAQIDLRGQGIEAMKRMGLDEIIRTKLVDEAGISFVNSQGKVQGSVMVNRSGRGAQSVTSEYEIMRGDLVRILYDATKDQPGMQYIFGKTVENFKQDADGVTAYFSDGSSDTFDILVGADGQGSRIRKAILPPGAPEPYKQLGVLMAYWFVPRDETDGNMRRSYNSPGGRLIWCRTHNDTESQAYFLLRDDEHEFSSIARASTEQQKEFWAQKFRGAGWQTERFIRGMETTENFYCQDVVQVKTDTWFKGRVVLLGDAAHCPSPFSGMGTTSALVGAYILAGELIRNGSGDIPKAFESYDQTLRPFVEEAQKVNTTLIKLALLPKTQLGITIIRLIASIVCFLRIPSLISRFSKEDKGGWKLPVYTELHADHR